jgi:hypothetical protein
VLLLVGLIGLVAPAPVAGSAPIRCTGSFQGTVTQGPDAGFSLAGLLTFMVHSSGSITGDLQQSDGSQLQISGSVGNAVINLVFYLDDGGIISGTGQAPNPFSCAAGSTITGSLSGPNVSDSGNWGIVYGS